MKTIPKITILVLICLLITACSKDNIIKTYDNINKTLGDLSLTNDSNLKGTRTFGIDHYVGTYKVEYKNFNGKEILFGGTTIERKNGSTIKINIEVKNSKGKLEIIMNTKNKEEMLVNHDGTYEYEFDIKDGSNYFLISGTKYSGTINIEIN